MSEMYVQTDALSAMVDRADVRIVDTRASLGDGPTGAQMWAAGHIPEAVHADWIADWGITVDDVEGMLPGPEEFASDLSRLGISNDMLVVCYDDDSLFTASRLAWALMENGHQRVAVLDGGFPAWQGAGLPISTDEADGSPEPREYRAGSSQGLRRDMQGVKSILDRDDVVLVDCRMDETFLASEGRIPGATRLASPTLIAEDGRFKRGRELLELAEAAGIDKDWPTVLYCGGGVSAAAVFLALHEAGYDNLSVYDGSWSEWSKYDDNPIQRHS